MSWQQSITQTLEAMEALSNPSSEAELNQLTKLGDDLKALTAQLPTLSDEEREAIRPSLSGISTRIESVIGQLEATRTATADSLGSLRNRAQAAAAYQKR